jgi:nucleotide-binding universal stress UspA family protein
MRRIIVAVDGSQGSTDAIALASTLAGITGFGLTFVNVFPYDPSPSRAVNREFEDYLRQDSRELLERVRDAHGDATVELKTIANPSAAHGLHELAEREQADLIVVGSTHTGRAGRVLPGSTAERLLHGAPCPVAVAPNGYAQRSDKPLAVLGCGYDGSPSSRRALEEAGRLAAATGARLRAIRVFEPLLYDLPPGNAAFGGMASYNDSLHVRAGEELEAAVASIETEGAESQLEVGNAAEVLADASGDLDLLLLGSRGYGPLHAVMVGGVSGPLVREAACPVIVFPRSAGQSEDGSLFAKAAALHG